jgi:predicted PurR-regulated permease PerM
VLAIAAGLITAGIAGALLAVPLLAVLNASIRSLPHEYTQNPRTSTSSHDDQTHRTDQQTKATWSP